VRFWEVARATAFVYAERHNGLWPKVLLCARPTYRALWNEVAGPNESEPLIFCDVHVIVVGEIAPQGFQARGRDYWDNFR